MSETPRLSFCMIARDEAANIARCLNSVAPIADEMIVIDTGSTDETAALARARGAAVFPFAWRDDFAAAYNAALDRVTGDWVLCLDADEWLLPECQGMIRELIQRPDAMAYWVQRQEMERAGQTDGFIEMRQLRLCRNDPALRCVGVDHPHFGDQMEERSRCTGEKILNSPIRIRHTGYLPEKKSAKLERAVHLLQKELAERPGQMYYEVELGRTWEQMNDPRGPALLDDVLTRVLAQTRSPKPPSVLVMPVLERCLRTDDPTSPRVRTALRLAARWFPNSPPLLDAAAGVYYRRGEFAKALPLLTKLVCMAETGEYDRVIAFASHVLGDGAYLNLAVCYHRLAQLDEAEHWYQRLLERTPGHPGALQNLETLYSQRRLLT